MKRICARIMTLCLALLAVRAVTATAVAQTIRTSAAPLADSVFIDIDPGKSLPATAKTAGDWVLFTLTAKYPSGIVVRAWGGSGDTAILTLRNCTANSDTSMRAYCSDASAYSWAELRIPSAGGMQARQTAPHEWRIPASVFVDGVLQVEAASSKAERGLYLEARTVRGRTVSQSSTIEYSAGAFANYLVEYTAQAANGYAVFSLRPFELIIFPRDRFLNVSNREIRTRLSARFPGEFTADSAQLFGVDLFIAGPTNYFFTPTTARIKGVDQIQYIMAYSVADPSVRGTTADFDIQHHAPVPFRHSAPADGQAVQLASTSSVNFSWTRPSPPDPWSNIHISRFEPVTHSDEVTYKVVFADTLNCAELDRFPSANGGKDPWLLMTRGELETLMQRGGGPSGLSIYWYVEATDGIYKTKSLPASGGPFACGSLLRLQGSTNDARSAPATVALNIGPVTPNPVTAEATVQFTTPVSANALLTLHDLLGREVLRILDAGLQSGPHTATLNARGLAAGTYILRLNAGALQAQRLLLIAR